MGFFRNLQQPFATDPTGGDMSNQLLMQIGAALLGGVDPNTPGGINMGRASSGLSNAIGMYSQGVQQHAQQQDEKKYRDAQLRFQEARTKEMLAESERERVARNTDLMGRDALAEQAFELGLVPSVEAGKAFSRAELAAMVSGRRDELDNEKFYGGYKIPPGAQGPEDAIKMVPDEPDKGNWTHAGNGLFVNATTGQSRQYDVPSKKTETGANGEELEKLTLSKVRSLVNERLKNITNENAVTRGIDRSDAESMAAIGREFASNPRVREQALQEVAKKLLAAGYTLDSVRYYISGLFSEDTELASQPQLQQPEQGLSEDTRAALNAEIYK